MKNTKEETTSILLENFPKDVWEDFKSITTRDKTLKQAVIDLIKQEVRKRKK